jgi:hypothetical protein
LFNVFERAQEIRLGQIEEINKHITGQPIIYCKVPDGVYAQVNSPHGEKTRMPVHELVYVAGHLGVYGKFGRNKTLQFWSHFDEFKANGSDRLFNQLLWCTQYDNTDNVESTVKDSIIPTAKNPSKLRKGLTDPNFDFFKVVQLKAPRDNFGNEKYVLGLKGKQPLNIEVKVITHLRMQPYGAGRNKRKLIIIDEYVKGRGQGKKIDVKKLDVQELDK